MIKTNDSSITSELRQRTNANIAEKYTFLQSTNQLQKQSETTLKHVKNRKLIKKTFHNTLNQDLNFLKRNPMNRNYNQSTLRMKNWMRKRYKKIWDKDQFKGINEEFD